MNNLYIEEADMSAVSIVQPLRPTSTLWKIVPNTLPYDPVIKSLALTFWLQKQDCAFSVISAVEVVEQDKGPEYHVSMCKFDRHGRRLRCDSNEARWIVGQFQLDGAEEDNHVPGGMVRNFWRPVAEPKIGEECPCKDEEPVMRENKGDFIWRPISHE